MKTGIERRRFRRADLDEVRVQIRPYTDGSAEPVLSQPITGQLKNVSLAGFFCYVKQPCELQTGQLIAASIELGPEQRRLFPFSGLFGKGWVIRQDTIARGRRAGELHNDEHLIGLAVAFAPDVAALGMIE